MYVWNEAHTKRYLEVWIWHIDETIPCPFIINNFGINNHIDTHMHVCVCCVYDVVEFIITFASVNEYLWSHDYRELDPPRHWHRAKQRVACCAMKPFKTIHQAHHKNQQEQLNACNQREHAFVDRVSTDPRDTKKVCSSVAVFSSFVCFFFRPAPCADISDCNSYSAHAARQKRIVPVVN